jgi:DNA-binding transcriptional MocR family regulator
VRRHANFRMAIRERARHQGTVAKAAVTAGVLRAGDALPSIRQLANDLELNSKTVAKAYELLERDAVIETKGSSLRESIAPKPCAQGSGVSQWC